MTPLPAYCINLDRRADRWQRLTRRFEEDGASVERFAAVTPEDPRVASLVKAVVEDPPLTPRAAAAALSHRDVWTLALGKGHERVLILEDDVFFHRDWRRILGDCLGRLDRDNPDWDLFLLNASGSHPWVEGILAAFPPLLLAGAYVVNAPAMEALTREFDSTCLEADWMLAWLQKSRRRSFFHFPYLALQEFLDSDIGGTNQESVRSLRQWFRENYEPRFGHLYRETFA